MKDLNTWSGTGRLGQDVQAPQGNGPAKFSIAVNDNVKKGDQWEDETSWIDIVYWHKSLIPKLTKGKQIAIQGRLRQEKWTDRESGANRSKLVIVADFIQLLGESRQDGQGSTRNTPLEYGEGSTRSASTPPREPSKAARPGVLNNDDFNDDIPF